MIRSRACLCFAAIIATVVALPDVRAEYLAAADQEFFERRIRPVLAERCWECHSADAAESDLRLDSLAGVLQGGSRGPAAIPGSAATSLMILAVNHADQVHMPPRSKIPQREIDDLTDWVNRGAQWPGQSATDIEPPASRSAAAGPITDEERSFWAFQPVRRPDVPRVDGEEWARTPIDRFLLQSLREHGLAPSPAADRRTLIRRASFDLRGLPPTPEEIREFLADESADAWERLVDRLLASPEYGVRWGRHWLDLARYGDSNGLDENLAFANAFRYRDYVVEAFNADRPYDEFLREQIAGDLLPDDDPEVRNRRMVATGFLSLGAKMLAEDDPVKMQMDIIDEQVDTLGKAVLGMTFGCARCHDHKYDPIRARDYYSLAGIFKSTRTMENFSVVARWQEVPIGTPDELEARRIGLARLDSIKAERSKAVDEERGRLLDAIRARTAEHMLAARDGTRTRSLTPIALRDGDAARANARVIEAEEYDRGNVLRARDGYGEGIGVLVNQGEAPNFVEYDVDIAEGGWHQVDVRYAALESRPCELFLNGRRVRTDVAAATTGGWRPADQAWSAIGVFRFEPGQNVLRLEQPVFFPHIDKLQLTPVDASEAPALADVSENLHPEAIVRWERVLADPASPFAAWRHYSVSGTWDGFVPSGDGLDAAVLAEPRPESLLELANRYAAALASLDADAPAASVLRAESGPWSATTVAESDFAEPVRARLAMLAEDEKAADAATPKLAEAMAVSDSTPESLRIHLRGSHLTLGDETPRGFPDVFQTGSEPAIPASSSGRRELAEWLTSGEHPLTGRVVVNRLWQHHFGEGLVRSSDNFGVLGDRPTHPELLDWLADELVRSGWSLKTMHRLILTSAAWRQSSAWRADGDAIDPENKLLWRMARRRLEAEAIRDSLLHAGRALDDAMGGTLLATQNRAYVTSTANVDSQIYASPRRTIYLPIVRSATFNFLEAFDFGDPSVMQGKRSATTVAPQALFLMNSDVVARQSERLAARTLENFPASAARVSHVFEVLLGREPTAEESDAAISYVEALATGEGGAAPLAELRAWQSLCRAVMATNEFLFVN
ncbi:MAG: DUF1553 domain-containing protein [Planctomyces sp.]|nr:DUF1553 domain-containing protein [Planctomyces sp.]